MQTTAGSGIGLWLGGGLPAQGEAAKVASGSAAIPDSAGVAKKFWIDPSIAAWRPGPLRKVHIEYHTSRHMPRLAEHFNADEFGDRLLAAHVNGATVFAKDMYELVSKYELDGGSSPPCIATNVCGSCARKVSIHLMRACSMLTKRSFASPFLRAFAR